MLLAVALILCATACHKAGRIIPKSKLEDIYFDMFMADEWLRDNTDVKGIADTTLFYEPIFHRYGYSFKDYQASVSHYLDDPDDFAKIFDKASKNLTKKGKKIEKKLQEEQEKAMKKLQVDPSADPFATAPVLESESEH